MQNKLPPHNIDAEENVIGSLLVGADISDLSLEPSDFYHERMQWCFTACKSLESRKITIDEVTLADELNQQHKLQAVGGVPFLSHLISIVPTSLDCGFYAEIVKRCSIYRSMVQVAGKINKIAYEQNPNVTESFIQCEELLASLRKLGVGSVIISPDERADMAQTRYEGLYKAEAGVALSTHLRDLDNQLGGGFFNGEMIILGARPGMGKTSMLMTIANNIAEKKNILFCSGEMPVESITDRDVAGLIGESIHTVRRGGYSDDVYDKINVCIEKDGELSAVDIIRKRNLYFYHEIPLTVSNIMQAALGLQLRGKLDLVVIDYLGLLDDDYGGTQYERVGYISRKLKQLAMKLDVPLLVAHQLNRQLEQRPDKRPQLNDLRDSGRIEEDADLVLFLYRDSYYQDVESKVTEIGIAKQRQGEANQVVRVVFDSKHQKYVDMVKDIPSYV